MADTSLLADLILDQMADAVIYADEQGIIQKWNRAAAALFGHNAAKAIGNSLDLIIPERLRAAHWRGFETAMKTGSMKLQGRPTLTRALHESGGKLYVEMTFALVKDQTNAVRGAVAVARDVTARTLQEKAPARPGTLNPTISPAQKE